MHKVLQPRPCSEDILVYFGREQCTSGMFLLEMHLHLAESDELTTLRTRSVTSVIVGFAVTLEDVSFTEAVLTTLGHDDLLVRVLF